MKRLLILILVLIVSGCAQLSIYDKYNNDLNLGLPRPSSFTTGKLIEGQPKDYEDFDLIFVYDESLAVEDQDFWQTPSDEERYELILKLYDIYQLDTGTTIEDKKNQLEDYLDLDLGSELKIYYKNTAKENLLLLNRRSPGELLMLRVMN
ncbi:MAG: hypothetical protein GX079_05660 [Tissierellia bacterium]|nr:hypothetical protein [Tissierellia bacterium]